MKRLSKKNYPLSIAEELPKKKIKALELADDEIALCADTTVALGRRILGKPSDRDEANSFLALLSGRRHKVITCVAAKKQNQVKVKDVISVVKMKVLSLSLIHI